MIERTLILHPSDNRKNVIVKESELIENALMQEQEGIEPSYIWYDSRKKETIGKAGWLVYSTWKDGAGVVYRREDGKMILITGWQGDFCTV